MTGRVVTMRDVRSVQVRRRVTRTSPKRRAMSTEPRDKAAVERTGACVVTGCCSGFEFLEIKDGFRMCRCGHSQFGHAKEVVTK